MNRDDVLYWIGDQKLNSLVDLRWKSLEGEFLAVQETIPASHRMARGEISFHDHVKLLGHLTVMCHDVPGDILEIGVWKGRSLSLMCRLSERRRAVFGIDPLELPNQALEIEHYHEAIYPEASIIRGYSERTISDFDRLASKLAILHIDGGHTSRNVVLDFLLYERYVSPGGYVVFDDYGDYKHSPEVAPAVDLLRVGGFFSGYEIFGPVRGFENSYLVRKVTL